MSINCQSCGSSNISEFLGSSNSKAIAFFCEDCFLVQVKKDSDLNKVQLEDKEPSDIEIVELSNFVDEQIEHLKLNQDSFVLELVEKKSKVRKLFKAKNIDCVCAKSTDVQGEPFGIEQAWAFIAKAHPVSKGRKPDLIIADQILSNSHDINEVLEAVMLILKEGGTFIIEDLYVSSIFDFEDRADIAKRSDFWFSTHSLDKACERHGLKIIDAKFLDSHIGDVSKMRWTIQHDHMFSVSPNVVGILGDEAEQGLVSSKRYLEFKS